MFFITRKYTEWVLNRKQKIVNKMFDENDNELTDEILDLQVDINSRRNKLDLPDKSNLNDEGFVQ